MVIHNKIHIFVSRAICSELKEPRNILLYSSIFGLKIGLVLRKPYALDPLKLLETIMILSRDFIVLRQLREGTEHLG